MEFLQPENEIKNIERKDFDVVLEYIESAIVQCTLKEFLDNKNLNRSHIPYILKVFPEEIQQLAESYLNTFFKEE